MLDIIYKYEIFNYRSNILLVCSLSHYNLPKTSYTNPHPLLPTSYYQFFYESHKSYSVIVIKC